MDKNTRASKKNILKLTSGTCRENHCGIYPTGSGIDFWWQAANKLVEDLKLEVSHYFEPSLLSCPHQSIASFKTELFAPVISAMAFETEEEAIEMANDSEFGLGAGVFTENLAKSAHRVSEKIRSGIVWINTYRAISPIAPFGGFKNSGGSREARYGCYL